MSEAIKENLNLNTVLLTIVVGLSAWTLKNVAELREDNAAIRVEVEHLKREVYGRIK
jgi:hypothetical protein